MKILTPEELKLRAEEIILKITEGAVFIYPTDTIYGIGCNALNQKAVQKIRKIKNRMEQPLSVWIPSVDWIKKNCVIDEQAKQWIKQLPGPYTLILKLKNKKAIAKNVVLDGNTIGIRIPDHWFNDIIQQINLPIITTSVNKAGEPFMTTLDNLDPEIEESVDFIIYEGEKKLRPSKIINLENKKITER